MKKFTHLLIVFTLVSLTSFSQSYIRLNAGYALPLNADLMGEENRTVYDPNTGSQTVDIKGVYGSYGTGASIYFAFGNTLPNGIIGYDLEVGYLVGKKYDIVSSYTYQGSPSSKSYQKNSAQSIQFAPSIFFKAHTGNFEPYMRMGPVMAITNSKMDYESSFNGLGVESKGQLSFGFKSSLGVNFFPGKKIQFYTEFNFINMAYAPKKGTITKYISDGVDITDRLTAKQKRISYEKDYSDDNNQMNLETRQSYSMSSMGIQVGVKYNF